MLKQKSENMKGGLFIALGMLLLAIGDNYIRFITEQTSLWQFHFERSLIAIPLLIFAARRIGKSILPQNFSSVLIRTLLMVLAMLVYFGSLAFFPISQVSAGLFTSPLFVIIFSRCLLKEQIYLSRVFAVLLGSFGVILVLGITFSDFSIYNLFPIAAGAIYALASITTRQWCREEEPVSLMFMFFCGIGLASLIIIILIQLNILLDFFPISGTFITLPLKVPNLQILVIIFMHALVSVIGGVLITFGYQKGHTSFVAVFEYSFLFFATSWAYLFFSDYISAPMLLGLTLIILSGFVISLSTNSKQK
tara:strand:- start:199 stop:1119 length:921 start_codon:yes stop_codon:yes gene_type:complete